MGGRINKPLRLDKRNVFSFQELFHYVWKLLEFSLYTLYSFCFGYQNINLFAKCVETLVQVK